MVALQQYHVAIEQRSAGGGESVFEFTELRGQRPLPTKAAVHVDAEQVAGAKKVTNILIHPAVVDFIELAGKGVDLEIDEYSVTDRSPLMGKTLRDSAIRTRSGAFVVAVRRADGEAILSPEADTLLRDGDTLILVGPAGVSERLDAMDIAGK